MLFALVAHDKPDSVAKRMENRPAHLKFLEGLGETVKVAGAFLSDRSEGVGSIVIIEAASLDEANAIFARDPYAVAGLFGESSVAPWRLAINNLK